MGLSIRRVKVADIKPLQDEYGNEYASRDYSLKVNKDYVKELAASFGESGEPDEPVKLVRDEECGCWRVKAGNSRVRAMQQLGTEECWAVVDDDDTVQSAVETVVRTDVKKKYEALEKSRYVQQLAMFGDDEYVGAVSGIGKEKAARMRKAVSLAGESSAQLSLDRLYVLPDFEGYPDMIEKIVKSEERDLDYTVRRLRSEKKGRERTAAFEAAAAKLKVTLVEKRPEAPLQYARQCKDPDDLKADYMAASAEYQGVVGYLYDDWSGVNLNLYGEPLEQGAESAEKAEKRRLAQEYIDTAKAVNASMVEWVRGKLAELPKTELEDPFNALSEACCASALDEWYMAETKKLLPEAFDRKPSVQLFAKGYKSEQAFASNYMADIAYGKLSGYGAEHLADWLDWVDLHAADGWEPDEGMSGLLKAVRDAVADFVGEDDGQEDE